MEFALISVFLFLLLLGIMEGSRLLFFRSAVASALSQAVDTLIFVTVAFAGVFPIAPLLGETIQRIHTGTSVGAAYKAAAGAMTLRMPI